jgi:RimJ/RimL family protein N-acetyltransferase
MILRGKKIILRPIKMSDAPRYVKWLSDSDVHKFTTRKGITLKEEKKWIRELPKKKNEKTFAIETRNKVHIGSVGLRIKPMDENAILGILIGDKRYWSSGYGTDAMRTILQYGFEKLKLHKISLGVFSYNPRAINLYLDMGFEIQGIYEEDIRWKSKYYDLYQMALFKNKWQKNKIKIAKL